MQPDGHPDIDWVGVDGAPLVVAAWDSGQRCIGIRLGAPAVHAPRDGQGNDDSNAACLLLVNAQAQAHDFMLPHDAWRVLVDTAYPAVQPHDIRGSMAVPAHALVLLID